MPRPSRGPSRAPDNLPRPLHWDRRAVCRGVDEPEVFFPEGDEAVVLMLTTEAKRYCARCPVRPECLRAALNRGETFGIWGGLDADERRTLVRSLKEHPEEAPADARSSAA